MLPRYRHATHMSDHDCGLQKLRQYLLSSSLEHGRKAKLLVITSYSDDLRGVASSIGQTPSLAGCNEKGEVRSRGGTNTER